MVPIKGSSRQHEQVDKVMEEYKDIFSLPTRVPSHFQVKRLIDLTLERTFTQLADIPPLYSRKWINQAADLGVATKRAHSANFLTLWEPDCTCTEEGWDLEALYWLLGTKQNHCQEQVSNPTDWWTSVPTQGGQVFQQYWSKVWLSQGSNTTHRCMEDCLQIQGRNFWMVGYSFRVDKCLYYFYEANGLHLMDLHRLIHGFLFGWHPHLQRELGRTLATHLTSPSYLEKCIFGMSQVQYLGYIIDEHGVHLDSAKIHVIQDWSSLITLTELRNFLGLPIFYQRFVLGFSHFTWPLSQITKGGVKVMFFWSESQHKVFVDLKHCL